MTPSPLPPLTPMAGLRWPLVHRSTTAARPTDILEIGCGQGALGARLARIAPYTGVEPDDDSWRVATARVAPAVVVHGTDADLPAGRTWSLVCAFEVLEHIEDDAAALAAWFDRTAPGGTVVLSVPAWQRRFGPSDRLVGHYRRYDRGVLAQRLRDAGFVDARETFYGWPLGYALEAVRDRLSSRRLAASSAGPRVDGDDDRDDRGRASGRYLQPRRVVGSVVRVAVRPFAWLQQARPGAGTGIVAVARRPGRREDPA